MPWVAIRLQIPQWLTRTAWTSVSAEAPQRGLLPNECDTGQGKQHARALEKCESFL
ncbi:MAG: hypothetical protein PVSMB7_18760 [Chloroflexota bacterium]